MHAGPQVPRDQRNAVRSVQNLALEAINLVLGWRDRVLAARGLVLVGRNVVLAARNLVLAARNLVLGEENLVLVARAQVLERRAPAKQTAGGGFSRAMRVAANPRRFNGTQSRGQSSEFRGQCALITSHSFTLRDWPMLGDMETAARSDEATEPRSDEGTAYTFPPAGWVRRADAARILGVSPDTLKGWYRRGLVRCGKAVTVPGGGRCKIYPVDELERLRDRLNAERGRLPDGLITREHAIQMFGTSLTNWKRWERAGIVPRGRSVQLNGVKTKVKAYTPQQLEESSAAFAKLGRPYADPNRPGVWRVPVMSFRETVCEALIDKADLPRIEGKRWNWLERDDGYVPAAEEARPNPGTPLKYVVLGLSTDELRVDHANGDPLDCRRANLIVRTRSEKNAHHRKARTYGGQIPTSRFKGVSWEKKRGVWRACIMKAEVNRYLGRFTDELAAAQAYDEAAREMFGEHARLNFPDGIDAWLESQARELRVAA